MLLQAPYNVSAVRLMWKDAGLFLDGGIVPGPYRYVIEGNASAMGGDWFTLVDASDNQTDLAVDYRTFEAKRAVRLRMRLLDWPKRDPPGASQLHRLRHCAGSRITYKAPGRFYLSGGFAI